MTESQIKALVRKRDGFKCVQCGMTSEESRAVYGKDLDVHRVTPGSPYAVDESCVTICVRCHGPKPKSPRYSGKYVTAKIDARVYRLIKAVAAYRGRRASDLLHEIISPLVDQRFAAIQGGECGAE